MMQNVFLTVSLVKRFGKPCIEAILTDYLSCLILWKVWLAVTLKLYPLASTLRAAVLSSVISWGLGVGGREEVGREKNIEIFLEKWRSLISPSHCCLMVNQDKIQQVGQEAFWKQRESPHNYIHSLVWSLSYNPLKSWKSPIQNKSFGSFCSQYSVGPVINNKLTM